MGWNSWDCYGTTVTEGEVLANAEFMAARMAAVGWNTVVVDIQWYEPSARAGGYNDHAALVLDEFGRQLPAVNRFPSATGGAGFAPLARQVHDLGLSFGLHVMRGIPRQAVHDRLPVEGTGYTADEVADTTSVCEWNTDNYGLDHGHPGAQAYYDSQLRLFASWGVDFVKADDMIGPYHRGEVEAYQLAIQRSGRAMVLSLSPGRQVSTARVDHLREHAQMWRVSDDLWDNWADVLAQFDRMARWAPFQRPGGWADADMLPVGRMALRAERGEPRLSRLTAAEQRTMITLWCVSRSPLMVGCDLPSSPAETIELLTHPDVLEILNASTDNREVLAERGVIVWTARSTTSRDRFVAIFNTSDDDVQVIKPLADLGLGETASWTAWAVIDAWTGQTSTDLRGDGETYLAGDLRAHDAMALRFTPQLRATYPG